MQNVPQNFIIHRYYPCSISTLGQRCFNIVYHHSNNIDPMLKMKQNLQLDFQCCTKLIVSVSTTERTLNQCWTTLMQPFFNIVQCCFNLVPTLIWHYQHYVKVTSTSIEAIQNQPGYWKVWICRKLVSFILMNEKIFFTIY